MRSEFDWARLSWLSLVCLMLAGCGSSSEEVFETDRTEAVEPAESHPPPIEPPRRESPSSVAQDQWGSRSAEVPLTRRVTQEVRQKTGTGWTTSRSFLELVMTVSLYDPPEPERRGNSANEAMAPRHRYQVLYHQVRYGEEIPGQPPVTYDSRSPPPQIPASAQPYHGLVDNGFRFLLTGDRREVQVYELERFIDRCVATADLEQRLLIRKSLEGLSGGEVVNRFVDRTVGMIPNEAVRVGDTWTGSRQVEAPVPLMASNRFTIRAMTADAADIDLAGTVAMLPTPPPAEGAPPPEMDVVVKGGKILGQIRLNRRTELPVQSRVEQSVSMLIRLRDGSQIEQQGTTTTIVESIGSSTSVSGIRLIGGTEADRP
ncbi:MAG: DUF6263 family protein [Planctomycetales bacterium]